MEKLLNKQMEEFIEILESDKNLTSEDVWTSHEKKEWLKLKQQEILKEALAEDRERVREYLSHYKTKSDCCSQTVDDIYTNLSSLDINNKE